MAQHRDPAAFQIPDGVQQTTGKLYIGLPSSESVRVLELHSGTEDEPIRCSLRTLKDYRGDVKYEAISYTWQDPKGAKDISCNGQSIRITKNLYDALHSLRHADRERILWVDAICINQQDLPERAQQVCMMRQIFAAAHEINIWLGLSNESSDRFFTWLYNFEASLGELIHVGPEETPQEALRKIDSLEETIDYSKYGSVMPQGQENYLAMKEFFERPWFRRCWVIQEVAECPNIRVRCGRHEISWDVVALAATWYARSAITFVNPSSGSSGAANQAALLRDRRFHRASAPQYLDFANHVRSFEATDPRDKLYSLFSLPVHTDSEDMPGDFQNLHGLLGIKPDYTISMYDAFRRFALATTRFWQDMRILLYTNHLSDDGHIPLDLPSWVPRWDQESGVDLQFSASLPKGSGSFDDDPSNLKSIDLNQTTLKTFGTQIGRVVANSEILEPMLFIPRVQVPWPTRTSWLRILLKDCSNAYPKGASSSSVNLVTARAAVLTCDSASPSSSDPNELDQNTVGFIALHETLLSEADAGAGDGESMLDDEVLSPASPNRQHLSFLANFVPEETKSNASWDFGIRAARATRGRRYFETAEGYVGLGPRAMREGDVVAICWGSYFPLVLRQSPSKERHWQFVGCCYLYGWMGSDAAQWLHDRKSEMTEWELI